MHLDKHIAVIGAGNMGRALVKGLLRSQVVDRSQICVTDPRADQRAACEEQYGVRSEASNTAAVRNADVIILAVKPQIAEPVLLEIRGEVKTKALLISIAAGITVEFIERHTAPTVRVVRCMPNVCCTVGEGATALAFGTHATPEDMTVARRIFDSVGLTITVDETLLDAVTGLSGSGPAFIFMVIDAMSDAGVKLGLSRRDSHALACQTVLGAAKLTIETQEHPGRLKDMVCSPGGAAIAAVHQLETGGLRTTLINAVEVAARRARELGSQP